MNKIEKLIDTLRKLPFTDVVRNTGGEVLAVGGVVRDAFLERESKDLDIMVTGIPYDTLMVVLEHFGKCDLIGESFGIIKWKAFGSTEELDISLPRTEMINGERGHKAFDVTTDPFLPIEVDLSRRDLTINAMALDSDGRLTDPFNGLGDIRNKTIRMANPDTFFDDPLRMLRAVQFASRFAFHIELDTYQLIKVNANRLNEISAERILIELEKIVSKGNTIIGATLLIKLGLSEVIFKAEPYEGLDWSVFKDVETLAEFIYFLELKHHMRPTDFDRREESNDFFTTHMKVGRKTLNEIKALDMLSRAMILSIHKMIFWNIFYAIRFNPNVIFTKTFPCLQKELDKFISRELPRTFKDLNINGNDLIALGFKGEEIGDKLEQIVDGIFSGKVDNNKNNILKFIKND